METVKDPNIDLLVRPRLIDYHKILLSQADADFCIPFIDEDIPLYIDPFLLWKSNSIADNSLHNSIVETFNYWGWLYSNGKETEAIETVRYASECPAVGLGTAKTKDGKRIGVELAAQILTLFQQVPQIKYNGFSHIEEVQLLVKNISKDRICDFTSNILSNHLKDYTIDQCERHGIPTSKAKITCYNFRNKQFEETETILPINPSTKRPMLFVPKHWLRYSPWLNPDEYFSDYYPDHVEEQLRNKTRYDVIDYNRVNYAIVQGYTTSKEASISALKSDPLFKQIPISSAKRTLSDILKLPTGKEENADKKYETLVCKLLSSLLYPHLDFAEAQSRIESGTQIRDLVFYNNVSHQFLREIFNTYNSRQIVFELKNVATLTRDHISQVNRYLCENFGKFGVIVTRNRPPKNIRQHLIDLWSGQRKCILVLTDDDLKLMVSVYENKQRAPYEVLKKLYVEFTRKCPM